MSSSLIRANIVRFVVFILIQGIILRGVGLEHIDVYLYPLFILMLPIGIADGFLLLISFTLGLGVDIFYGQLGLFASASVFLGAMRQLLLGFMEPRGGYDSGRAVTRANLGTTWFAQYSGTLLLLHALWITLLEELTFSWFWLFRVFIITILSLLIAIIYQFIFNPKE